MQSMIKSLAISSAFILLAGNAMAERTDDFMHNLPNGGVVTIAGTVDKVGTQHEFTLRNDNGIVIVKMVPGESGALKENENVVVTGVVEKPLGGIFGNDIAASKVETY